MIKTQTALGHRPKTILIRISLFLMLCLTIMDPLFSSVCSADTAKRDYLAADACYKKLRHTPAKQKYREYWLKCIGKYQKVFSKNPSSSWAPAGMYASAELYLELYKRSYRTRDQAEAIDLLKRIIKRYPKSAYKGRSQRLLKKIIAKKKAKTVQKTKTVKVKKINKKPVNKPNIASKPKPRPVSKPEASPQTHSARPAASKSEAVSTENGYTMITGLRYWSNPEYTRVVIDGEHERSYFHKLLKKDPDLAKPQRLYVDINDARLGKDVPKHTDINDNLLTQARAGQYDPGTVRVVVDIKSFDNYKVFSLKDPFRLVIDVWAKKGKPLSTPGQKPGKLVQLSTDNIRSSAIAKQLALGVKKIVIDPGHGGKDPGARGYKKGVWEKTVVLDIAKKLAKRMRDRLHCSVELTRSSDRYLALEERTAIANTKNADLFISLHCNAAKNKRLAGIETYYLNLATDDQAITVAARENATSKKNISDLESILNDLMKNAKINESSRLAVKVQDSLYNGLRKKYSKINSLGVKQAPFYVLLGARMPSILIEASFLSNKTECNRLTSKSYQEALCDSIIDGVESYINETNPKVL